MASKKLERLYLDGFLKGTSGFELVEEREAPDFVLRDASGLIGIELVQVFVDQAPSGSTAKKGESTRQKELTTLAEKYYSMGGRPLNVKAIMPTCRLADPERLANLLLKRRPAQLWDTKRIRIGDGGTALYLTSLPDSAGQYSNWRCANDAVGWVRRWCTDLLTAAIQAKASKLHSYRTAVSRVALLIVADSTQASGMMSLSLEDCGVGPGDFDAVYFYRHPIDVVRLSSGAP